MRPLSLVSALLEAPRVYLSLVPRGWWRRPPFLPLPDRAYLGWRLVTVYGGPDDDGRERAEDDVAAEARRDRRGMLEFLAWRRQMRRLRAGR